MGGRAAGERGRAPGDSGLVAAEAGRAAVGPVRVAGGPGRAVGDRGLLPPPKLLPAVDVVVAVAAAVDAGFGLGDCERSACCVDRRGDCARRVCDWAEGRCDGDCARKDAAPAGFGD